MSWLVWSKIDRFERPPWVFSLVGRVGHYSINLAKRRQYLAAIPEMERYAFC